jgi:tetratricopeptide (TPR) repeat protein
MHPQLADYQHLELASIWLILRENSDCLSQCQQIQDFRTTPAALRIMAKANHLLGRHADALPQLELYLNVMGSIPSAFDLRAATLESLNRRDEAHAAWKALLQILPADPPALAGWARTMPPGKTDALIEHLRGLDNAGARAAAMAFRADVSNVPWAFESLAEFVAQTGADSCNAFLVAARRQRFEGEYAKSCQTLRAAHERAATKEDRDLVLAESIDCLLEANTPPEALDGAPRHGRFSLA